MRCDYLNITIAKDTGRNEMVSARNAKARAPFNATFYPPSFKTLKLMTPSRAAFIPQVLGASKGGKGVFARCLHRAVFPSVCALGWT
jgi:hypothetical protein